MWIENEAQSCVDTLRTNDGGEYTSKAFEDYLCWNGIKHCITVLGNPQQNGVAERMNRTILNIVRAMLYFKVMKFLFWVEATFHVVDICNWSPYQIWYGHPPWVKHLRIFGSPFYASIPKENRNKLEHKSWKCIFLGYFGVWSIQSISSIWWCQQKIHHC